MAKLRRMYIIHAIVKDAGSEHLIAEQPIAVEDLVGFGDPAVGRIETRPGQDRMGLVENETCGHGQSENAR